MLIAILILVIFDIGLTFIIGLGGQKYLEEIIKASHRGVIAHIDDRTETAVTAIYNMDGLKAKATMSGKVEV